MSRLNVLFVLPVFLLLPAGGVKAQMTVAGPPSPTAHTLMAWFAQRIPAKFAARGPFEVQPLSDFDMDEYLHAGDSDDHTQSNSQSNSQSDSQNNSEDDEDEIDGVFEDHPPCITLRMGETGTIDLDTFAHEYGHYVWFDLLTGNDRKRYKSIYNKQKAAHKLITDYAAESVEEGFAEAFAADVNTPAALLHQDSLSYRFLSEWPKEK